MVYQEQVMQMAQIVAATRSAARPVRRAMGKKKLEEMARSAKFREGARRTASPARRPIPSST
jgi:DNA polymerase III alpha subunit